MLPKGWNSAELGDLVDRPIAYGVLKPETASDGVSMIRINNISASGSLNTHELMRIKHDQSQEYKRTIVREGDLVLSVVGTIGRLLEIPVSLNGANLSRAMCVIGITNPVQRAFVRHILRGEIAQEWMQSLVIGAAQKVLNLGVLRTLAIPVPPLPEQRRIAAVLDAWDAAIATAEQMVRAQKVQFRAILARTMDPLLASGEPVRNLFDAIGSGAWGEEGETGLRILRNADFCNDGYLALDSAPVRQLSKRDIQKVQLSAGDLVLEKSGGGPDQPVGRVCRFVGPDGFGFSNFLLRLTPKKGMSSLFCYFVFERMYQRKDPLYFQQQTTGIRNLEWQDYLDLPVVAPERNEQERIAKLLVNSEVATHQLYLLVQHLRQQKRGLMQQLLTGRLRVPESIDALLPSPPALDEAA